MAPASAPSVGAERHAQALGVYEETAHFLMVVAVAPPGAEPRPPWWRPLARRRHLVDHAEDLARWAELVEDVAEQLRQAESALAAARWMDECLR